jgi:GNAT superfamily N-acetyltransferase
VPLPPGLRLRRATRDDAPALLALYRAAYSVHEDPHRPPTGGLKDSLEDVRGYVEREVVLVAVHEATGALVASVALRRIANVRRLAVAPDRKGQGVGAAMLEAAADEARAEGFDLAMLTTFDAHPWLPAFYERHGFEAYSVERSKDGNVWRQMRRWLR